MSILSIVNTGCFCLSDLVVGSNLSNVNLYNTVMITEFVRQTEKGFIVATGKMGPTNSLHVTPKS